MFNSLKIFHYMKNVSTKYQRNAKSKAETIKKLNYENKLLFGSVQKSQNQNDLNKEENNNSSETEVSSEIYWLIDHKHKKEKNDKKKYKSAKNSTSGTQFEKKSELRKFKVEKVKIKKKESTYENTIIPFNKNELKSILKFPLILNENDQVLGEASQFTGTYPSVGKILQATMSEKARKALINWKLSKIAMLGEEGFKELQQGHMRKGKKLHEALQAYLLTDVQPEAQSEIINLWESVFPALESLQPKAELTEATVEHPFLKYKGIIDCVSRIGNDISVIEWKKSDKHKNTIESTFDAPVQLCAYLGALSADPKHKVIAKQGFIVVAYSDKKPAEVHHMDEIQIQKYWNIWLKKVQEFWIRTRDGTLPEPL